MASTSETTTPSTTDRNGWPSALDPETGMTVVTFPNGNRGFYRTCRNCGGSGAVEASWGELFHCTVCSCRGMVLVETRPAEPATDPDLCVYCESQPAEPGYPCCDNGFCKAEWIDGDR